MLLILTVIIAILAPLIRSRIPTEAEIKAGKVDGFTGTTNTRVGDYLLSTICFCGSEGNEPPTYPYRSASLRLFEYYMYHHNTTYMLKDVCQDGFDCALVMIHNDSDHDNLCDTWIEKPTPGSKRKKDLTHTMCYLKDPASWSLHQFEVLKADKITFDGFTRDLAPPGGQGPRLRSREEADARCEVLCEQQIGLPVLKGTPRTQPPVFELLTNHMIAWEDLDDMCGKCK